MSPNSSKIGELFNRNGENERSAISLTETVQQENVNLGDLLFAAEEIGIPERTYRLIFPFEVPSNAIEERLLKEIGEVEYMKLIRTFNSVDLAVSAATVLNGSSWLSLDSLKQKNSRLRDLAFYVHREDMGIYQASRS